MDKLKKLLNKEYKIKNLRKVKTIIGWKIINDLIVDIIKINQSAFIRDLVIKKKFRNCNTNVISIKANTVIKMTY